MSRTALLVTMVAGISVAGCGSADVRPPAPAARTSLTSPKECKETRSPCYVNIINVNFLTGEVTTDADYVRIEAEGVTVVWTLPSGYEFREADGILLKHPDQEDCSFDQRGISDGKGSLLKNAGKGSAYQWHSKATKNGTKYEYEINFCRSGPFNKCFRKDPFIING